MSRDRMTSMQRVLTTLGHEEPDRTPLFFLFTVHGAKELGVSIQTYFADPRLVCEGQMRLLEKYRHDCIYTFHYAAVETEAWGGSVYYREDGPPNAAAPIIGSRGEIAELPVPDVTDAPSLRKVVEATRLLKAEAADRAPIIGVVMSPFSLPVMQMGFGAYIELMYEDEAAFWQLMEVNMAFCADYANAQLAAGATAICYFDPVSSPEMVPRSLYERTGFKVAKETLPRIAGPTATHFASGKSLSIADLVVETGTAVVGVSGQESLTDLKNAYRGKATLLGNLNGVAMRRWTEAETRRIVKASLRRGAPGGGFILSDNHGEIPYQVPDATLKIISETVHEFGQYPIPLSHREDEAKEGE